MSKGSLDASFLLSDHTGRSETLQLPVGSYICGAGLDDDITLLNKELNEGHFIVDIKRDQVTISPKNGKVLYQDEEYNEQFRWHLGTEISVGNRAISLQFLSLGDKTAESENETAQIEETLPEEEQQVNQVEVSNTHISTTSAITVAPKNIAKNSNKKLLIFAICCLCLVVALLLLALTPSTPEEAPIAVEPSVIEGVTTKNAASTEEESQSLENERVLLERLIERHEQWNVNVDVSDDGTFVLSGVLIGEASKDYFVSKIKQDIGEDVKLSLDNLLDTDTAAAVLARMIDERNLGQLLSAAIKNGRVGLFQKEKNALSQDKIEELMSHYTKNVGADLTLLQLEGADTISIRELPIKAVWRGKNPYIILDDGRMVFEGQHIDQDTQVVKIGESLTLKKSEDIFDVNLTSPESE